MHKPIEDTADRTSTALLNGVSSALRVSTVGCACLWQLMRKSPKTEEAETKTEEAETPSLASASFIWKPAKKPAKTKSKMPRCVGHRRGKAISTEMLTRKCRDTYET
eukprot:321381_1